MLSLYNKRIILGITGGIAAYKAATLCRLLTKSGAEVRVVMTSAAIEFITPLTMQALSGNRVHSKLLDEESEAGMGHIELARWADLILIAPASADFISRICHGEANDLLSTICLASRSPIAIAPAMNQAMWENDTTQSNLSSLQNNQVTVFGPASGDQACGEIGPGRMLEAEELATLAAASFQTGALAGVKLTITAGPTREALDPVRYISNHSSGKMGYALARAAVDAGARVTLISGPVALKPPQSVNLLPVESAEQMLAACLANPADVFISVAAVVDYRPEQVAVQKIKKADSKISLSLCKTPDILATIANLSPRPFSVGFAAETENLAENAKAKLRNKNLDLIFANHATDTFSKDEARATAYWHNGEQTLPLNSKDKLANTMITLIAEQRARL